MVLEEIKEDTCYRFEKTGLFCIFAFNFEHKNKIMQKVYSAIVLGLLVLFVGGCKKKESYEIQEHPDYKAFIGLFEGIKLPLKLEWKNSTKRFEWSKKPAIEAKYLNQFVDSLAEKHKIQYHGYGKLFEQSDFCVLLLGVTGNGGEKPGWVLLSLRKDGLILGKEHFRFAENSMGRAKLWIESEKKIVFSKDLTVFQGTSIKTIQKVFEYKIDDEGRIKEKDEEQSENLTELPRSFLNNFGMASTPFYITSEYLHSVKAMNVNEYMELKHENWYVPLSIDTLLAYFPSLQRYTGDGLGIACGAYKTFYKHEKFSVGLVVIRQAGNQSRSAITGFHLFTFDRKAQKVIDVLPMVAYVVEIYNEQKNEYEYSLGTFQFFDDMRFAMRQLKGVQESNKDVIKSGYVKEDGYFMTFQ